MYIYDILWFLCPYFRYTPGLGQFRQALVMTLVTIIFNNEFYKL